MLASLFQNISPIDQSIKASHILVILPKLEKLPKKYNVPGEEPLGKLLLRREIMCLGHDRYKQDRIRSTNLRAEIT